MKQDIQTIEQATEARTMLREALDEFGFYFESIYIQEQTDGTYCICIIAEEDQVQTLRDLKTKKVFKSPVLKELPRERKEQLRDKLKPSLTEQRELPKLFKIIIKDYDPERLQKHADLRKRAQEGAGEERVLARMDEIAQAQREERDEQVGQIRKDIDQVEEHAIHLRRQADDGIAALYADTDDVWDEDDDTSSDDQDHGAGGGRIPT